MHGLLYKMDEAKEKTLDGDDEVKVYVYVALFINVFVLCGTYVLFARASKLLKSSYKPFRCYDAPKNPKHPEMLSIWSTNI